MSNEVRIPVNWSQLWTNYYYYFLMIIFLSQIYDPIKYSFLQNVCKDLYQLWFPVIDKNTEQKQNRFYTFNGVRGRTQTKVQNSKACCNLGVFHQSSYMVFLSYPYLLQQKQENWKEKLRIKCHLTWALATFDNRQN